MKKKIVRLTEQDVENLVKKIIKEDNVNEASWDFDWDSVLGDSDDKYHTLEREVSNCIEPLVEKYKSDFGNDSYAVIDAILQIVDGMFQRR